MYCPICKGDCRETKCAFFSYQYDDTKDSVVAGGCVLAYLKVKEANEKSAKATSFDVMGWGFVAP